MKHIQFFVLLICGLLHTTDYPDISTYQFENESIQKNYRELKAKPDLVKIDEIIQKTTITGTPSGLYIALMMKLNQGKYTKELRKAALIDGLEKSYQLERNSIERNPTYLLNAMGYTEESKIQTLLPVIKDAEVHYFGYKNEFVDMVRAEDWDGITQWTERLQKESMDKSIDGTIRLSAMMAVGLALPVGPMKSALTDKVD